MAYPFVPLSVLHTLKGLGLFNCLELSWPEFFNSKNRGAKEQRALSTLSWGRNRIQFASDEGKTFNSLISVGKIARAK